MAHLKMLAVEAADSEQMPPGKVFRTTTHHVKELFLYFLPEKFSLDGSSKLQITLTSRQAHEYKVILGTSEYVADGFDFRRYFALPPREQEKAINGAICSAITDICARVGVSAAPVEAARSNAEGVDFKLRYEIERLQKGMRSAGLKVRVFRKLAYEVGEAWEAQVEKEGEVVRTGFMRDKGFVDLRPFYKSASVEGSRYTIKDRFGETVFEFDLSELVA